ncbi:hypothetical protein B0T24DRAFT_661971 [Lasiosphaeria ovina]|uniref:Uncharacterized protein n=1 Tax=Lasiosphaeria ovina TaxID=92902 RepID=A0AAE0NKZ6_9PEZI|nr:hypothetical protein B0T24DRAFT_661971 [Lasiosphaeria ovina]
MARPLEKSNMEKLVDAHAEARNGNEWTPQNHIYCRHFRLRFRLGSQCHLVKEEMWPYGLDGMADMVFLCRIAGEITCLRFRLRASTRPGSQGYLDKDQMRTDTVSILASPEDSARTNKIESMSTTVSAGTIESNRELYMELQKEAKAKYERDSKALEERNKSRSRGGNGGGSGRKSRIDEEEEEEEEDVPVEKCSQLLQKLVSNPDWKNVPSEWANMVFYTLPEEEDLEHRSFSSKRTVQAANTGKPRAPVVAAAGSGARRTDSTSSAGTFRPGRPALSDSSSYMGDTGSFVGRRRA